MLGNAWDWWLHSDAGLLARIGIGVVFFGCLGVWDAVRHGRQGRRWREYLFLLAAVAAAVMYGVVNDQITVTISWEYFFYGKELMNDLGPAVPPDEWGLRVGATVVGAKATWTVGLLGGAALLLANNPRPGRPCLGYGVLFRLLGWTIVAAAGMGGLGGLLGYLGAFDGLFEHLLGPGLWRPERFMAAWGVHLGGYVGGVGAVIAAVAAVVRRRGLLKPGRAGSDRQ